MEVVRVKRDTNTRCTTVIFAMLFCNSCYPQDSTRTIRHRIGGGALDDFIKMITAYSVIKVVKTYSVRDTPQNHTVIPLYPSGPQGQHLSGDPHLVPQCSTQELDEPSRRITSPLLKDPNLLIVNTTMGILEHAIYQGLGCRAQRELLLEYVIIRGHGPGHAYHHHFSVQGLRFRA